MFYIKNIVFLNQYSTNYEYYSEWRLVNTSVYQCIEFFGLSLKKKDFVSH